MSWFEVEVHSEKRLLNLNSPDNNIQNISKRISDLFIVPAHNIERFESALDYNDIDLIRGLHSISSVCLHSNDESITVRHHRQITEGEIFTQLLKLYKETEDKKQFINEVLHGTIVQDIFVAEKTKGSIVFNKERYGSDGEVFVMQGVLYDVVSSNPVSLLDLYKTVTYHIYTNERDLVPLKQIYDGLCTFVLIDTTGQKTQPTLVKNLAIKTIISSPNIYTFTNGLPIYVTEKSRAVRIVSGAKKPKYYINKPDLSVGVIALSGGLDSSITLFEYVFTRMLSGIKFMVQPLYFDYGHRTAEAEYFKATIVIDKIRDFIKRFAEELGYEEKYFVVENLMRIDIKILNQYLVASKSVLFGDNKGDVSADQSGTAAYVPNRNDIMLSIGAAVLESLYLKYFYNHEKDKTECVLMFGANLSDGLTYRDNAPIYIEKKEQTLKESLMRTPNLLLFCPFINATKTTYLSDDWFAHMLTNYLMHTIDIDFDKCYKYASLYNRWKKQIAVNTLSCRYATVEKKNGNMNIITSLDRLVAGEIGLDELSGPEASKLITFKLNGIHF